MSSGGAGPEAGHDSARIDHRAEIIRLARILHVEPGELSYLDGVPAADLRTLRFQILDTLSGKGGIIARIASSAKLLPAGTAASIAEGAFGPVIVARMAGHLEPDRLLDLAGRLSDDFLAQVAAEIDPRAAGSFLGDIPPGRVTAVAQALIARREFAAMGSLVGHLPDGAISGALAQADAETRLQIALLLEDRAQLRRIAALDGDDRLRELFAAAQTTGLDAEAAELLPHLDDGQRAVIEGGPSGVSS